MTQQLQRLTEIADEITELLGVADVLEILDPSIGNTDAVENRLRDVLSSRHAFECIELAMYLRMTYSRSAHLPTWQPLLNATAELIRMRKEDSSMLYGIVPMSSQPVRNTGQPKL